MYKLCSTEKSAQQQRQLEQAFLTLLLQMPYDSIRISEVCRQAGCSRKVFYRLFESKTDMMMALIDHTLLDFEQHTGILSYSETQIDANTPAGVLRILGSGLRLTAMTAQELRISGQIRSVEWVEL
mgnify:CR=1 FL=1